MRCESPAIREAIRSIESWDGGSATFESEVGKPVNDLVAAVGEEGGTTAPLYRAWSALVKNRKNIERAHALDLWDRLLAERGQLRSMEHWQESTEPVLAFTLASVWTDLFPIVLPDGAGSAPGEEHWLRPTLQAMRATCSEEEDGPRLENLVALLDLAACVLSVNMGKESILSEWRGVVVREAKSLAARAKCRTAAPLSVAEVIGKPLSSDDRAAYDAARLVLCTWADGRNSQPSESPAGPLEDLAKRVVERPAFVIGASGRHESVRGESSGIERLLRHHALESPCFAHLLHRLVGYEPYRRPYRERKVESVDGLEQRVLLLGPPGVGKSSFFFASETLPWSGAPDLEGEIYPSITLEAIESGGNLDEARSHWRRGEYSHTDDFKMTGLTDPLGLCRFHLVDPRGEMMGLQGRSLGADHEELFPHIQRLRPSTLVVMLSPDIPLRGDEPDPKEADVGDVEYVLGRTLDELKSQGASAMLPVYLLQNKADKILDSLRGEETDKEYWNTLAKELESDTFEVGDYFFDDSNGAVTPESALSRLLDDPSLTCDPGVRELIADTCRRWKGLLVLLAKEGFRNVSLSFTCTLCPPEDNEVAARPGVRAFWYHLWEVSAPHFQCALQRRARKIFVEELSANIERVWALRGDGEHGLRLREPPRVAGDELRKRLQQHADKAEEVAEAVRGSFDRRNGFDEELRGLYRTCRRPMELVDEFDSAVARFREDWKKRLRIALGELNVPPDRPCEKFRQVEVDPKVMQWLGEEREKRRSAEPDSKTQKRDSGEHDPVQAVRRALEGAGVPDQRIKEIEWKVMNLIVVPRLTEAKRIDANEVHGYYGALVDSSILRGEFGIKETFLPDARQWLRGGGSRPLAEHLANAARTGYFASDQKLELLRKVLWLVSDYGFDNNEERWPGPDYASLTVRLLRNNRPFLQTHVEMGEKDVNPHRRIEDVIELVRAMFDIHGKAFGGPEGTNVVAAIRSAVAGFVLGPILDALGFNVDKLMSHQGAGEERDGMREGEKPAPVIFKQVEDVIVDLHDQHVAEKKNRKRRLPFVGRTSDAGKLPEERRELLLGCEKKLAPYRKTNADILLQDGANPAELKRAINTVSFARRAVESYGDALPSDFTPDLAPGQLGRIGEPFRTAVQNYNPESQGKVDKYVENVLRLLLRVHHLYFEKMGFLVEGELKTALDRVVSKAFNPRESVGAAAEHDLPKKLADKAVKLLEECIADQVRRA